MTARMGTPIRLGVPVDLHRDEWLHSAISRWAWQTFGVSRSALFDAFGLSKTPQSAIAALGTRLLPEIASNISYATGITEQRLRGATMESLDEKFLLLMDRGDGQRSAAVSRLGPWSWQAGTRYCPDCLRQQPGVFRVHWRSPWVFICTVHRRVLLDACPSCQGEIVEMRGRNTDAFDPSTCRASTAPKGATRRTPCRAALEDTWEHLRLDDGSAPMLAQQSIFRRERAGVSMEYLSLLQAAATGLRGARAFDEIGMLSGLDSAELRGLFDDEKHIGISAPRSAYAMAGLAGAAFVLTHMPEVHARKIIRRATFARPPAFVPRGVGFGPGSPLELLSRWPGAPERFRAQVLRAHDQDLTIGQRITWDTAVSPSTLAVHRSRRVSLLKRTVGIPEQLWPAWCSRLDVGGKVNGATLAHALAIAVRLTGTCGGFNADDEKNLAAILRPNMLGTFEQTRSLLAGISELSRIIDDGDVAIEYPKRINLPAGELLTREHWEILAGSVEGDSGADRRHRNARRYLWQRITATGIDRFPDALRIGFTRDDSADYTDFRARMTAELQGAFDRYGRAFLRNYGDWDPVTWAPEVAVNVGWPGAEITDLDIDLLHTMLLDGIVTRRRLAETLRRTPRQVLRAIDAVPPKTGRNVKQVDWKKLLPPRLPERERPILIR